MGVEDKIGNSLLFVLISQNDRLVELNTGISDGCEVNNLEFEQTKNKLNWNEPNNCTASIKSYLVSESFKRNLATHYDF
jgi:hypothetical protein